jgi:hypothetical protein
MAEDAERRAGLLGTVALVALLLVGHGNAIAESKWFRAGGGIVLAYIDRVRDGDSTPTVIRLTPTPLAEDHVPGMTIEFLDGPLTGQVSIVQSLSPSGLDVTVSPRFTAPPAKNALYALYDLRHRLADPDADDLTCRAAGTGVR